MSEEDTRVESQEREWPRIMYGTNEWIPQLLIPGTWEQDYVAEVGQFVLQSGNLDPDQARTLNEVMLNADFTQSADAYDIFERVHHAEAKARGLKPNEMTELLASQKNISSAWVSTSSFVDQRSEILDFIGFDSEDDEETRSAKIYGFSLCASEVWMMKDAGLEDKARGLYESVRGELGLRLYDAKADMYTAQHTNPSDIDQRNKEISQVYADRNALVHDYFVENVGRKETFQILRRRASHLASAAKAEVRKFVSKNPSDKS